MVTENQYNKPDWNLLKNGFINTYKTTEKLTADVNSLKNNGYRNIIFDAKEWNKEIEFHEAVAKQFHFPDYYGKNLNAFNDCMVESLMSVNQNIVIVLDNFHFLEERFGHNFAWSLLDIVSDNSRMLLVLGKKVITLIRSERKLEYSPIGGKIPEEVE